MIVKNKVPAACDCRAVFQVKAWLKWDAPHMRLQMKSR